MIDEGLNMFDNILDTYTHSNNLKDMNTNFKVLFGILTMLVSLISTSPIVPFIIAIFMSGLILFKAKFPGNLLKFLVIPFLSHY